MPTEIDGRPNWWIMFAKDTLMQLSPQQMQLIPHGQSFGRQTRTRNLSDCLRDTRAINSHLWRWLHESELAKGGKISGTWQENIMCGKTTNAASNEISSVWLWCWSSRNTEMGASAKTNATQTTRKPHNLALIHSNTSCLIMAHGWSKKQKRPQPHGVVSAKASFLYKLTVV